MIKMLNLLLVIFLSCGIGNCQLLSKPSLTIEDFELALKNTDHLRKILKKHHFEYFTEGATKFSQGWVITNPLVPDLRARRTENWELKNQQDHIIIKVNMYDWEPNHAPNPEVVKTVRLMIGQNSIYSIKMEEFLKKIKDKYPNKSQRYFRNNEVYQSYAEPMNVFTNNSKIEVRTENTDTSYGLFYIVNFDLIR